MIRSTANFDVPLSPPNISGHLAVGSIPIGPFTVEHWCAAYTVSATREPVRTRRGLLIVPDRLAAESTTLRRLPVPDPVRPLRALDTALRGLETDYGPRTATWVATQMEYPGFQP